MATELQLTRIDEREATVVDPALEKEFRDYEKQIDEILKYRDVNQHDDSMLDVYAWRAQALQGDMDWHKEMRDFVHRAKWHTWLPKAGKTKEEAMKEYIEAAKIVIEEEMIRKQLKQAPGKLFVHPVWTPPERPAEPAR